MNRRLPISLAVAAVAAGAAIGCGGTSDDPPPAADTGAVPDTAARAVVALSGERLGVPVGGTGFVYDLDRGLIATSAWNVTAVDDITARVGTETAPIPARVGGIAPCEDVAVLELGDDGDSTAGLEQLALGSSSELKPDQPATALGYGNQFQTPERETLQRSQGTIADPQLSEQAVATDLPTFPSLIEVTTPLEPGFSGGPLLDESGAVAGMLVATDLASRTPSYAIPSQRLRGLLEALEGDDRLAVGWYLRPIESVDLEQEFQLFLSEKLEAAGFTPAEAAEHVAGEKLPEGMYVLATERKSPVDDSNLFPGDMVTEIEGEPVRTITDVCEALDDAGAGAEIEVDGIAIASSTRIADIGEKFTVVVDIPEE